MKTGTDRLTSARQVAVAVLILAITLAACSPVGVATEGDSVPGETQTAESLDQLAEGTIEALKDQDKKATSAVLTAQPTSTQPAPTATMTITPTPTLEFVEVEVFLMQQKQ